MLIFAENKFLCPQCELHLVCDTPHSFCLLSHIGMFIEGNLKLVCFNANIQLFYVAI